MNVAAYRPDRRAEGYFGYARLVPLSNQASGTSKETEIKPMNVARASLEELVEDSRDFLRTLGSPQWDKNSREVLFVRKLGSQTNVSYQFFRPYIETRPAQIAADIIIFLIHQTNYLLDRLLRSLERDSLKEGSLRTHDARSYLRPCERERALTKRYVHGPGGLDQIPADFGGFGNWIDF